MVLKNWLELPGTTRRPDGRQQERYCIARRERATPTTTCESANDRIRPLLLSSNSARSVSGDLVRALVDVVVFIGR
jgi:hypothetical protein